MPVKSVLRTRAENTRRSASNPQQWRALCQKALRIAQQKKDRRAGGLQKALDTRREMQTLTALGIICENDLVRVFSNPQT